MKKTTYIEPAFKVVKTNCEDILTMSMTGGGDPYNMMGDQPGHVNFHNVNWFIDPLIGI